MNVEFKQIFDGATVEEATLKKLIIKNRLKMKTAKCNYRRSKRFPQCEN